MARSVLARCKWTSEIVVFDNILIGFFIIVMPLSLSDLGSFRVKINLTSDL